MASKIRVLSDQTINKIAAGEVIENPASVVKELVENSLDAGAKEVCIEIQGGGRQLIRISDNGCGMNSDDALLCLERHATSKIRDVEDIHAIYTMGFRGEALPSIASISKFTLITCPAESHSDRGNEIGTMVIVDGGKMMTCTPAARSPGTTVEVKSLFFNVPARKKFLKSPVVDANEVLKVVSLMALGYPKIKFQLISDGKNMLMAPLCREADFKAILEDRIVNVLGQDFLQNTSFIESENGTFKVQGFVGQPAYTRHNRTGQYLFINQRAVISPLVSHAIKEGYGTSLVQGRYPVFVLHLNVPGDLVDVNVHPQKKEVRLRQELILKELLIKAVEQSLQQKPHVAAHFPAVSPVFAKAFSARQESNSLDDNETWTFKLKQAPEIIPEKQEFSSAFLLEKEDSSFSQQVPAQHHMATPLMKKEEIQVPILPIEHQTMQRVLATIPRYILVDAGSPNEFFFKFSKAKGGLLLIDQSAAHARIIFEKLQQGSNSLKIAQQALLIPYTVEVSRFEAETLRKLLPEMNLLGIQIQEFGPQTFLIDAIPQVFGNSDIKALTADLLNMLNETSDEQGFHYEKEKKIALAASRAAISNKKRLTVEEAQSLLAQLIQCKQPYQCPMGKPILAHLSSEDLVKLFQKG